MWPYSLVSLLSQNPQNAFNFQTDSYFILNRKGKSKLIKLNLEFLFLSTVCWLSASFKVHANSSIRYATTSYKVHVRII